MRQISVYGYRTVEIAGVADIPPQVSGGVVWYDFSDISTLYTDSAKTTAVSADGDAIGAVVDKFGNGNDALQATTANKPTYKTNIQNSLSVARGDGGDNLATAAFTEIAQPNTTFVVVINAALPASEVFHDGIAATKRSQIYHNASGSQVAWYAGTNRNTGDAAATSCVLYTAIWNGGSSQLYTNGTLSDSGSLGTNALTGVTLFSDYSGAGKLTGDICEFILYDSGLGTTDRETIESYLIAKWGIT